MYWIPKNGGGRLGIAARPRGGDWIPDEVTAWRSVGVDTVILLLTPEENAELELVDEARLCAAADIRFYLVPIPERSLPTSRAAINQLGDDLLLDLEDDRSVFVHCRQRTGRSSLVAASVLIASGEDPERALVVIESTRGRPMRTCSPWQDWTAL